MNSIKVFLDRHFPYEIEPLNKSGIKARKVTVPSFFSGLMGRVYHVAQLYARSFKADVIMGNRRSTLMLGLLYHVYKPKKVSLIGYEIIFNFKENLRNKAVILMWRIAVKKVDKLIVMSDSERNYLAEVFHAQRQQLKTIPFYTEEADFIGPNPKGYIFAAGRMERDFITLVQALQQSNLQAIIVADESQQPVLEPLKAANVKILYNIPKKEYHQLLQEARLVVVPLYKGAASRGQVVILEAMKYGKPVVCSRVDGTVDYIKDGETGLLVTPENTSQLRSVLDRYFEDIPELNRLGKNAFEAQRTYFSPAVFHQNFLNTIQQQYSLKNINKRKRLTASGSRKSTVIGA